MLLDISFEAIEHFIPFIHPMKDIVRPYYQFCESISKQFSIVKPMHQSKTRPIVDDNPFIITEIKQEIHKLTHKTQVSLQCGETRVDIVIYHKQEPLETFLKHLLQTIAFVVNIQHHKVTTLDITIYLTDVKRLADTGDILDKKQVNGGSCQYFPNKAKITLWRKEELLKVTIHELIHGLHYDYKQDPEELIYHYQQKYDLSSTKMNTFEAYTEIHAELIHCYLLTYFTTGCDLDLFAGNVAIEREFSRFQVGKVLDLCKANNDINKETNVCAYYIIKTEIYDDLHNFVSICQSLNHPLIKLSNLSKYINYLKKLTKVVYKKKTIDTVLDNTTRMTCLELNLFET